VNPSPRGAGSFVVVIYLVVGMSLQLLLLSFLPDLTNSSVSRSPYVVCNTITDFRVCATGRSTRPAPAQFGNGTTVYLGGFSDTFYITSLEFQDLQGQELPTQTISSSDSYYRGVVEISVSRDDNAVCKSVTVWYNITNTTSECASCTYCGDDEYSADCTNVPFGRSVTCELANLGNSGVFFFS